MCTHYFHQLENLHLLKICMSTVYATKIWHRMLIRQFDWVHLQAHFSICSVLFSNILFFCVPISSWTAHDKHACMPFVLVCMIRLYMWPGLTKLVLSWVLILYFEKYWFDWMHYTSLVERIIQSRWIYCIISVVS